MGLCDVSPWQPLIGDVSEQCHANPMEVLEGNLSSQVSIGACINL